jgi:hypothetical protein
MDESSQRNQLDEQGKNPPGPGDGCLQWSLALLLLGAMLIFDPVLFFLVILFTLIAVFISLFLKRWFSSWDKVSSGYWLCLLSCIRRRPRE